MSADKPPPKEVEAEFALDNKIFNDTRTEFCLLNIKKICREEQVQLLKREPYLYVLRKGDLHLTIRDLIFALEFYYPTEAAPRCFLRFHPPFSEERVRFWWRDQLARRLGITVDRQLANNVR